MCVLKPLLVTLTNFSEQEELNIEAKNHPSREDMGSRSISFSEQLYIDQADFSEDTSLSRKKFKRLVIGDYVRLRGAYIVRADDVVKNAAGDVIEVIASLVPNTVGNDAPEGIKARGVIHWVDAASAVDCTVNIYDRLFNQADPDQGDQHFLEHLNPDSLKVIRGCKAEASLEESVSGHHYQFEREGYFMRDTDEVTNLIFNCTIGLRDNWKA